MPFLVAGDWCWQDHEHISGANCTALSMTALAVTKPSTRRRVYRNGMPRTYGGPLTAALTIGGNHELRV